MIITNYVIGKEMLVQSASNLTCVEYCPTQFPLDPYGVDPEAKDKVWMIKIEHSHPRRFTSASNKGFVQGKVTIGGKQYEDWYWEEKILIFIVMEKVLLFPFFPFFVWSKPINDRQEGQVES